MQIAGYFPDVPATPRIYRNRPYSPAFGGSRHAPLCEVLYLIEADPAVREEITACFAERAISMMAFSNANEYLNCDVRDSAACLILGTDLPDISAFDLQQRLSRKGNPPVIFVSDHADIPTTVRAMKAGALEFLTRPIDLHALVAAVQAGFAQDRSRRRKQAELAELQSRFALLTPREREVLPLVVGGLLNKQAASLLGISEVTLQIHRSQVMRKTQAESFADLVRMAMKLRIPYWRQNPSIECPVVRPTFLVPQTERGTETNGAAQ